MFRVCLRSRVSTLERREVARRPWAERGVTVCGPRSSVITAASEWATVSVLAALAGRARSEEERGGAPAEGAARVRGERGAGERRARVSAVIRAERRPRGRPTLSAGTPTRHVAAGRFKRPPFHGSVFTLLGLLAKIKCSICSYQFDLWYAGH